ncbi:hypothetical protein MOX02_49760 [Methylobacterium oxalidis]|uniref:DDE domain-containing protein n=1 Tax=Methylobacterium oxalidis TaxID=944322 RepID=A0A512JAF4_9HYPH|nr:hypothetical protein MOX02_49760 [Methylobacterium oxalidis]GJE34160.1 hypothetical protein LDDCCGHA_4367 [Methylobacterium oxalidis]GLS64546.1 hypothetical protein GCM10007888_29270 [Methylobacterium oxalidis]
MAGRSFAGANGASQPGRMRLLSYSGYRFPRDVIQRAVWMYLRSTLSFQDVEELLAERGISVAYGSIRRWVRVFGPLIARSLRARRPKPHGRWHLDEMFVRIGGRQMYLWRPSELRVPAWAGLLPACAWWIGSTDSEAP